MQKVPRYRPQTILLTPEQELAVRRAIANGATRDEAAAAAGITPARLWARLRDQLKDVRVGRGRRRKGPAPPDPTPQEIAIRMAECRAKWTPERWGVSAPWAVNDPDGHGLADPLR